MSSDFLPPPSDPPGLNPYQSPVASPSPLLATKFFAKTWMSYAVLIIFGGLGLLGIVLAPLFWLGILRGSDGSFDPQAGPRLMGGAVFFLGIAAYGWQEIKARRLPLIQLYREGVKLRLLGKRFGELKNIRAVGGVLLHFLDLQCRELTVPWQSVQSVSANWTGLLLICEALLQGYPLVRIEFTQNELNDSTKGIAVTINQFRHDPELRRELPSEAEE